MQRRRSVYDPSRETIQVSTIISSCLTQPCANFAVGGCSLSRPAGCFYFHGVAQRRRPVIGTSNKILYTDLMCPDLVQAGKCSREPECSYSHSKTELCYHPARFRTKVCNGFECRGSVCCFAHSVHELRSYAPLLYGSLCGADAPSETNPVSVEILRVPTSRPYFGSPLTRFCISYPNCENCEYGSECPYAHTVSELVTPLLDPNDPDFYVLAFKTRWCIFSHHHDWNNCIYAHNSQDCRRPPEAGYGPLPCNAWECSDPHLSYSQRCSNGIRCPYSHGRKEQLYHPAFYRTNECCDWRKPVMTFTSLCIRGCICAFFHDPLERRVGPNKAYDYNTLLEEEVANAHCSHLKERPALVSAEPLRARNQRDQQVQEVKEESRVGEDLDIADFVKFALN